MRASQPGHLPQRRGVPWQQVGRAMPELVSRRDRTWDGVLQAKELGRPRRTAGAQACRELPEPGGAVLHTTPSVTLDPGGGAEGFKGRALRVRLSCFGENTSGSKTSVRPD